MSEKARGIVIREHRIIQKVNLPKLGTFIHNTPNLEAWYCLREYVNLVKGWAKNYYLILDERFAMPMSPYKLLDDKRIKELTNQDTVADQACNLSRATTDFQMHKTRFYDFLGIAAIGAVIAVIIIAILALKGKINIGAMV